MVRVIVYPVNADILSNAVIVEGSGPGEIDFLSVVIKFTGRPLKDVNVKRSDIVGIIEGGQVPDDQAITVGGNGDIFRKSKGYAVSKAPGITFIVI